MRNGLPKYDMVLQSTRAVLVRQQAGFQQVHFTFRYVILPDCVATVRLEGGNVQSKLCKCSLSFSE